MNQRIPSASTAEFFNNIGAKRTFMRLCSLITQVLSRPSQDLVKPNLRRVAFMALVPQRSNLQTCRRVGKLVDRNRVGAGKGVGERAREDGRKARAVEESWKREKMGQRDSDPRQLYRRRHCP